MFVCKRCHEHDRIVTKCKEEYESHIVTIYVLSPCSICGESSINLKWCGAYKEIRRSAEQKALAANKTKKSIGKDKEIIVIE